MTMTMTTGPTAMASAHHEDEAPPPRPNRPERQPAPDQIPLARPMRARVPVGRREQRSVLASLIDDARDGRAGAVVLHGPRGSGKTHLLEDAVADAVDCCVLRSRGVEVEAGVSFGTVQQLCGPLVERICDLPQPQAEALGVALGLVGGPTPDPFLVGIGLVSLLAAAAIEQPVICVIDDAEWIDASSAQAIGVAARRSTGVGVAFLLAAASAASTAELAGVPDLQLHPLSQGEAQLMLGLELPGRLDPAVRDRVVAETRGNPLVIAQFGRSTSVSALAGGFAVDMDAQIDAGVVASVLGRRSSLSEDDSNALLIAAAEPLGDATTFRKAIAAAGLQVDVQSLVERTGVVDIDNRVLFVHPLVRHVLYSVASDRDRRWAHRVLADSVDGAGRADHASWHRARACNGLSEDIAAQLEDSSLAAGRAGGIAAAASFLERAAALSESPDARARRALEASRLHIRSGGLDAAIRLIADSAHERTDDGASATARLAAAEMAAAMGQPDAARDLVAAAQITGTGSGQSAANLLSAFDSAAVAGRLGRDGGVHHVAASAWAARATAGDSAMERLLLAAAAWWSGADVLNHDALARAIDAFCADESGVHPMATRVAMELWDEEAWAMLAQRDVDHTRRTGAAAELPKALDLRACLHLLRGEVGIAESVAHEARAVARRIGVAEPLSASILLTAWRCSSDDPLEWIDTWSRGAGSAGDGGAMTLLDHCRALVHNASGRYEQALDEALQVFRRDEPFVSAWAAPEVVEAAVRTGRPDDGAQAFECIRSISGATGSSWAVAVEHRCAALLSDDTSAEHHFRESIRHSERSGMRLDLARTHLLYGEWLRRQKRRVDARAQLRRALEVFDALGAAAFATRASLELRASGEQARRRTPDTIAALTEREAQVAELASDGHSNPDIGTQLFISSRTVEYHLHKVFSKLGITSRAQLGAALQV